MHVETYLNDFRSSAQVKIQVEFNFKLFWKKNQIFWFPCCSTCEDLSIDVSITYVWLILTKPGRFFSRHTETRGTDRTQFWTFEKISHSGFPWCSTHEDHSIDVSITNVGLILTKLRWFQLCQTSKLEFRTFFKKKIKFLGFHGVVLVKTLPLMYQLLM